ncbi:DNA translocase FtsK [Aquabacterium sp.]|uniref:DNA translocase FtsK n=1 Tax=Aquabacterium sp. TaxID=1872578 RepID=UPI0025BB13AA|nr:DNA translocase FtsK [Aquabacterium sp.]
MTHPDPQCAPVKAPSTAYTDALLQRATIVVLTHRQASISLIQRHLKIGYSRALGLMGAMVRDNILSQDIKEDGYRAILLSDRDQSELILKLQSEQIDDSRDASSFS